MSALDDAASAALFMLALERDPKVEHIGALYDANGLIARTETVSTGDKGRVSGSLQVPKGALRALFHNHPMVKSLDDDIRKPGRSLGREFPRHDISQARRLGVPSYISTPDGDVRRFDPRTGQTSDVLGQIPLDEFRSYLMRTLLDRAPDDPRGLKR